MSIASAIAVSGLKVASLRLRVAASNLANSLSTGPLPDAANAENFP
ncbi:MAG: flagellar basal body protein, partial [Pseudolabrys sp.]